jgi:hypothetical protein
MALKLIPYKKIKGRHSSFLTNASGGSKIFTKPTDNIGNKTFTSPSDYKNYADQYIYKVNIPGCSTPGRVFVGQRKGLIRSEPWRDFRLG